MTNERASVEILDAGAIGCGYVKSEDLIVSERAERARLAEDRSTASFVEITRRINGVIVRIGGNITAYFPRSETHAGPVPWWPKGGLPPDMVQSIIGDANAEIFDAEFRGRIHQPGRAPVGIIILRGQIPGLAQALADAVRP